MKDRVVIKLFISLLTCIVITCCFSGCVRKEADQYLPVSDVVDRVLQMNGISNCHITSMIDYKHLEVYRDEDSEYDYQSTIEAAKESVLFSLSDKPTYELDPKEEETFKYGPDQLREMLLIGVIGYQEFGKEDIPDDYTETELLEKYAELKDRVLILFIKNAK